MPNPIILVAGAVVGVSTGRGRKRVACGVAALVCGTAIVPGPRPFIVACAFAARGVNRIKQ